MIHINFSNFGGGDLPQPIRAELAGVPRAGEGVHHWLFVMALKLQRYRRPEVIEEMLAAAVKGCGRVVPFSEIRNAVKNSRSPAQRGGGSSDKHARTGTAIVKKWPAIDVSLRARIIAESPVTLAEFCAQSPTQIVGASPDVDFFIDHLFLGEDTLLCIGTSVFTFSTFSRFQWRRCNLHGKSLIVPSPMTAQYGVTKDGKRSEHTLDNTGPRRYLVTEFDSGTPDEQVALIAHLRKFAPLVMVLSSGNKSLHAWWNCVGDEDRQFKFFRYAVSLGADPATWTRSQFVRLPQGWRADKDALQQVYFFDRECLPATGVKGGNDG